jgi:hypothetical protein
MDSEVIIACAPSKIEEEMKVQRIMLVARKGK